MLALLFSGNAADSIAYKYSKLVTDEERVAFLDNIINGSLSDNPRYADSLAGVMLEVAEFSRKRSLICEAYLNLSREYINYGEYRNNLVTGEQYASKCLQLAKTSGLDQYVIASYLVQARARRARSDNQKALEYNNLALSLAVNYGNDSITSVCYSGLANTWMNVNNKLSAFQNRLSAREFAEKSKSPFRLIAATIDLANFYFNIEENEKSKDLFYKAAQLARQQQSWEYVMVCQRSLAEIYVQEDQKALGMSFYTRAMHLADSVGRSGYKINIYFDLINYFLNHETAENALKYFDSEPAITNFLIASGESFNIDKIKGFYYSEKKQYDSADYYFSRVLEITSGSLHRGANFSFYKYLAGMYAKRNMPDKQLAYLQRSLAIADTLGDIQMKRDISLALDSFYLSTNNFKEAFTYYSRYNLYNDSLRKLSEQKDLLSIEIDNENKRKIREEEQALLEKEKRNNIQYRVCIAFAGNHIF